MTRLTCALWGHTWTLAYLTGFEAKWRCPSCDGAIVRDQADWPGNSPEPSDKPDIEKGVW